jgi:outer membrane protein assembly factor BamB
MYGVICCSPAGELKFDQQATEKDRLEKPTAAPGTIAKLEESPADWPTYRADNARSARTQAAVPAKVKLLWQSTPKTAFEPTAPVACGGVVFLAGSDGIVRAFDAPDGKARWTAYTGGAVRYPPTISGGRAFIGSGDGWAYALEAATGRRLWRFRAAPAERRISIYGSLLSTWPVTGGILVDNGVAYLAAGINNFDGTHVYALDAATGQIKWQNSTSGNLDSFSRRGVAAQGDMLLHEGKLYLAGGCATSPGVYDIANGKCLNGALSGGNSPSPRGRELKLENGRVVVCGQPLYSTPSSPVFDGACRWDDPVIAAKNADLSYTLTRTGQGNVWTLAARDRARGEDLWTQALPAEPVRWGIAVDRDGRIIVTLRDGRVLCYGADK